MNLNKEKIFELKALTDIWTGDLNQGGDFLITTGILGSIRWWFEVLVRGMGGSACDPTKTDCKDQKHCVVCELFGCTGWARKFRFVVLDQNGEIRKSGVKNSHNIENKEKNNIKKDEIFSFRFTPFRHVRDEEWVLLDATLRLIADYGAIGGKIVLKPSEKNEDGPNYKSRHGDYGLIKKITRCEFAEGFSHKKLKLYLSNWPKPDDSKFSWTSLKYFWCVQERYLARQDYENSTFNLILGREQIKNRAKFDPRKDKIAVWLAGSQRESKKVFSFKRPKRTFGFVKPGLVDFAQMRNRIGKVWTDPNWNFLSGPDIIQALFINKDN